ncbi:5'-methylthioadenosine/adenosylhomocysteine nucleosidase [Marinicrinis sediminis]|uniref:adenosylhomocysteine nucleosidase n=1 Tax=Marinicrinis sediminis TaxID=1652465 RepID=A0ABW5R5E4_9BACL
MMNRMGIIGAMIEEIELLEQSLAEKKTTEKAGTTFLEGTLHGLPVVVTKCGVGKVNAAMSTQILIDTFEVSAILFTGVAGAVDPRLGIGDIVISEDCMQHDMDVTALGFERGVIPFQEESVFKADRQLADLAYEKGKAVCQSPVWRGRILSGDQFIADKEQGRQLHAQLGGMCTEMEGAAVAQVCSLNKRPFVIIRSMSDRADGSAHENFAEFTKLASRHSFEMSAAIVQALAESENASHVSRTVE